jgi:hypothetical protein
MSMSPAQLKQLGMAASAAVAHQRSLGAVVMPADMVKASKSAQNEFWRHQQIALATQRVCSFKDMVQDEYRTVMQHFEALAGPGFKQRAVASTVRVVENAACHRAPGCEYVRDMYFWMAKAGYQEGYAVAIMKGKFRGVTDLRLLNERQLKMLHDTVVNRCRAKLGLGEAENRNKKERGVETGRPSDSQTVRQPEPERQRGAVLPANGAPPPVGKSREYVLRPRGAARTHATVSRPADPDNEPF